MHRRHAQRRGKGIAGGTLVGLLIVAALVFVLVGGSSSNPGQPQSSDPAPLQRAGDKPHPRLDSALSDLVTAWEDGRLLPVAARHAVEVLPHNAVRVVIETAPGQASKVRQVAAVLGAGVELAHEDLIQVTVPIHRLAPLAEADGIRLVRLPFPVKRLVESEGVELINADEWHTGGYRGSGLKAGILDIGFKDYDTLLGTELPSSVTTWWAPSIGGPGSNVHGAACAEIVYDIAPEAQFFLANIGTDVEWASAVDWFIGQGVDVISCSLGWLHTGPGDGTGPINDKVSDARAAGIAWSNSAGNQAQTHWAGAWNDPDGNGWLDFSTDDETNRIYASSEQVITIGLRWDDPWDASGNDYDLYLYDNDMNSVASSTNWQTGTQRPREYIRYTATYSGDYHIRIKVYDADGTSTFDLMTFDHTLQYQVAAGSLLEPADSSAAMTLGAVAWHSPDTLESFSSRGPTTDGRIKPDLVGPDGVSTVSYGSGSFYGTSAAAPHGAGAAVLVRQRFPAYSPAQIQEYLEANAIDLGATGKDNLYGSGRLYLPADVTGTVAVFRVERETGNVYAAGSYYGSGFHTGSADLAEWVRVSEPVKPGDVLEIDPTQAEHYRLARGRCSPLVAGVVSTAPGIVLGSPATSHSLPTPHSALLALLGIVPVNVTDEGGPIRPGDLLVASSTPGHAMRWDPDADRCDTFVGKALEPLESGTGVIEALLMR